MSGYHKRQTLLIGELAQKALHQKSIAIIGCGGLGCGLAYALSGSGIGKIYLVDFDKVDESNIHRQIAFGFDDVGKPKCQALASALKKRSPKESSILSFDGNFEDFTKQDIKLDLLLDATDNVSARLAFDKWSKNHDIPWLYSSVEQWYGQICLFEQSSFKKLTNSSSQSTKAQTASVVMSVASLGANVAFRYLVGLEVQKDKLFYLNFEKGFIAKGFEI